MQMEKGQQAEKSLRNWAVRALILMVFSQSPALGTGEAAAGPRAGTPHRDGRCLCLRAGCSLGTASL